MSKRRGFASMTTEEKEDKKRLEVYNNPPTPSSDAVVNMTNALKWRTWGWSMSDAYTKAGVSKKSFKRSGSSRLHVVQMILVRFLKERIRLVTRAQADIQKGGSGLDLKGGRPALLSDAGVASLNERLISSAKSCKAVKQHEFGGVLRSAISVDNDNSFVDISLDPKTIKKYQIKAAGVVKPADVKSASRLKAFENIRNQVSCAAMMMYIYRSVDYTQFFSADDVSILVNKMDGVKPKVILPKEAIEFLNSHHISVSTDGAHEQQRMITFNLCIGGGGTAPSKIIKFADRNFDDLKVRPKIIMLGDDLSVILYHPALDEIQLNIWMFQICIIPQLERLRYAVLHNILTIKYIFPVTFFSFVEKRRYVTKPTAYQRYYCHKCPFLMSWIRHQNRLLVRSKGEN